MAIKELLDLAQKDFKKKYSKDRALEIEYASDINPCTGLIVDNPLLEYVLDRRFLAYGRCYLIYGKKGNSKTSLVLNLIKMFQQAGGDAIWIETEKAADLDYAKKQGVNLDTLVMPKVTTLQESLTAAEAFIKGLAKAYPDGNTPVIIVLDSIAGAIPEYEVQDSITVGETKVGEHARLMSGFYRRIIHPLAYEKAIFVALNQLKVAIGKFSPGNQEVEAMIGGEAPRFHSTYQWKVDKITDLLKKNKNGIERKVGSRHKMTCKRNKLGREGNSQHIEFDLYERGGIDWWCPLIRQLAVECKNLLERRGGYYYWEVPNTVHKIVTVQLEKPELDEVTGKEVTTKTITEYIPTDKAFREAELALIIKESDAAKELIRKEFGIPDLPPLEVMIQTEEDNKKKRGKKIIYDEDEIISLDTSDETL